MTRRGPVRGGVGSGDSLNFQPQRPRWPTSTVLNYLIFLPLPVSRFYNFVPVPFSKWLISHNMGCVVSCNLLYHEFMLVFIYGGCCHIQLLQTDRAFVYALDVLPNSLSTVIWTYLSDWGVININNYLWISTHKSYPNNLYRTHLSQKKKSIFVLLPIWLDLNQDFIF